MISSVACTYHSCFTHSFVYNALVFREKIQPVAGTTKPYSITSFPIQQAHVGPISYLGGKQCGL